MVQSRKMRKQKGGEYISPYEPIHVPSKEERINTKKYMNKWDRNDEILQLLQTKIDKDDEFKKRVQLKFNTKFTIPTLHAITTSPANKKKELKDYLSGYDIKDKLAEEYKDVEGVQKIINEYNTKLDLYIENLKKEEEASQGGKRRSRKTRKQKRGGHKGILPRITKYLYGQTKCSPNWCANHQYEVEEGACPNGCNKLDTKGSYTTPSYGGGKMLSKRKTKGGKKTGKKSRKSHKKTTKRRRR